MKHLCMVLLTLVALLLWSADSISQDAKRGSDTYKVCASCHGFQAQGNALVNAPSLAGQEDWYLARQIENFRQGIRGSSADDVHGQTMATMTLGLSKDDDVENLVAYIGTLPVAKAAPTLDGNADAGAALYQTCAACHGADAEGNRMLNAPALAGMPDWYQLAQLQKFKSGERGAASGDVYGMQMAPMAAVLADESAMRDVVAYINSL